MLAGKAYRSGFYWPSALSDAAEMVKRCKACQFHANQIHQPTQGLQTIPITWPFAVWGLDILGPFPQGQGCYRYLYVGIDKFTKWAEVEPVGGGGASAHNTGQVGREVHPMVGVSLRHAQSHHHRQWQPFH
jgi:hypothetical protein